MKILPPKNENFQIKNPDIFHISAQNIDCGYSLEPPRRGGSNEYPQSVLLSRNMKNNVYPCKPQFYYIKVGFKGYKLYRHCSCDGGAILASRAVSLSRVVIFGMNYFKHDNLSGIIRCHVNKRNINVLKFLRG